MLDEAPNGLVVTFGGLLEGHSVTIRNNEGYFWYSLALSEEGDVTAQTKDSEGLESNLASYFVWQM